jgi:hypothetical protein
MYVLPDRTDQAVCSAIERWVGLLVEQRFEEALAMLAPPDLLGHARYDLPLDGAWSDVTAMFEILDLPEGAVLGLDDVHVL